MPDFSDVKCRKREKWDCQKNCSRENLILVIALSPVPSCGHQNQEDEKNALAFSDPVVHVGPPYYPDEILQELFP